MRLSLALVVALALSLPAAAAKPYHLELEATPEAAFPYLGKFGAVDLHVYQGGVRGEALFLHGFSKNGEKLITVANPLGRMYVEMPTSEITSMLVKLAGNAAGPERKAKPKLGSQTKGTVKGIAATRHRLLYGRDAFIDVWTTDVIPQNPQLRTIVNNIISGIAPGSAAIANKLPGTPIYVELNFRRFKKVAIVRMKKLTFAADDEEDALKLGILYFKAGTADSLFK